MKAVGIKRLRLLLYWGEEQRAKVLEQLRIVPPELPEYDELLTRLDRLEKTLLEVKQTLNT